MTEQTCNVEIAIAPILFIEILEYDAGFVSVISNPAFCIQSWRNIGLDRFPARIEDPMAFWGSCVLCRSETLNEVTFEIMRQHQPPLV